jgi:hypothetical protein
VFILVFLFRLKTLLQLCKFHSVKMEDDCECKAENTAKYKEHGVTCMYYLLPHVLMFLHTVHSALM